MSRTTYHIGVPGKTYYAHPLPPAPWSPGVVSLTETGAGVFTGDLADDTDYGIYHQSGASPAETDTIVATDAAPVVAPDNTGIATIAERTRNLPDDPAGVADLPAVPTAAENASEAATVLATAHGAGSWETGVASTWQVDGEEWQVG